DYVKRCIESVLHQTYKEIELIIVDDGSTDNSYQEVLKLVNKNKDRDIKVFQFKENNGPGYVKNYAIKQATGKYIYFIDSDDYIPTDTIQLLVDNIGNQKIIRGRMHTTHMSSSFAVVFHHSFNLK